MAPVLRQIYDQMAEPKWVLAMGVCASSGGMFNNYAIVQGVDHVVPVDIYLPGCPPRPEMLLHAILKLHDKIQEMPLGVNREEAIREAEKAALAVHADHRAQRPAAVMSARAKNRQPMSVARTDDMTGPTANTRGHRRSPRHVRRRGQRRHVGLRPAGPPGRAARQLAAALRRLLRRGRRRAGRRARRGRLRRSDRACGGLPRRADAGGASRASARGGAGAARRRRRCGSSCASASAACTTPATPAANCTRSTR